MTERPPVLVYTKYEHDLPRFEQLLARALPEAEIHCTASLAQAASQGQRAQIFYGWGFPAALLRQMPKLRWVQKMGAGVDDIIEDWPFGPEVLLTRTDGRLISARMGEYVIGAILDKSIGFDTARRQREGRQWEYYQIGSIRNQTIGLAGLGEIGSDIARTLRLLGADIVGWRRSPIDDVSVRKLYVGKDELPAFVQECHTVVLALPLTRETKGLFDAHVFRLFRMGSHLINIGRGAVLDEAALLSALSSGHIGHATLDVFATEPLPEGHPFWAQPKITITPHVCGPLVPEDVIPHFVQNYRAFTAGKPLSNVVDVKRQY